MKLIALIVAATSLVSSQVGSPPNSRIQTAEVSFKESVTPILKKSCYNCHSGEKSSKGLKVDTYENLMKGTTYGKVVVPSKSAESVLVKSIKGLPGGSKMPPGRKTLSEADVKIITNWIDQGAKKN